MSGEQEFVSPEKIEELLQGQKANTELLVKLLALNQQAYAMIETNLHAMIALIEGLGTPHGRIEADIVQTLKEAEKRLEKQLSGPLPAFLPTDVLRVDSLQSEQK